MVTTATGRVPAARLMPSDDVKPSDSATSGANVAFGLGWTMAQLYGPLRTADKQRGGTGHLPTVAQLSRKERIILACSEIAAMLEKLPDVEPLAAGWEIEAVQQAWDDAAPASQRFSMAVEFLHVQILGRLAVAGSDVLPAYQLGRALNDTCWGPTNGRGAEYFLHQFSRYRLAAVFAWLDAIGAELPPASKAVVRRSLQHWQDWSEINTDLVSDEWETTSGPVIVALRRQGKAWESLLSGQNRLDGSPSVAAWVQAGSSMIRIFRQFFRTIIERFWISLSLLLSVTGALVYLIVDTTSGATTVWSTLVTVAGSLGITGVGVRGAGKKAVGHLEPKLSAAAEIDAWAWQVTLLPDIALSGRARRALLRAGTAPPHQGKRSAQESRLSGMGEAQGNGSV